VRHHLGISSFGVNAFRAASAGDRIINEHDEAEPDLNEELYVVLSGRATFEIAGERVDAPTGTLVFVQPDVVRTAFAEEDGTSLLALGAAVGRAYEAHGYELWAPLQPLFQAGEYAEVADRGRDAIEAHNYPMLFYNLACCESLAGRPSEAIEHLGRAIEMSDEFRSYAEGDSDFDPIREQPGFRQLVS
jgi:tetratricopeptide (TPR) repeat protein